MKRNLDMTHGLIHSQQVLLLLTEKGISRESAYRWVQRNAMRAWEDQKDFKALLKADTEVMAKISERELEKLFDLDYHFRHIDRAFKKLGL